MDLLNHTSVTLGNISKVVNIKVPLAFIIGDMQGGDKLASCSPSYNCNMSRICRKCNVKGNQSGDPLIQCCCIHQDLVQQLVNDQEIEKLKAMNQYNVDNVFFHVCFGETPYGVFIAATTTKPLHSLEIGLIKDCIDILFNEILTPKPSAELDTIAQNMYKWPRQRYLSSGADKTFPCIL